MPVTPEQAVQREEALTPEERSKLSAVSNLALGNPGGISRTLSDSEREHLTRRLARKVTSGIPPVRATGPGCRQC